jgi:hypothetical protein
MERGEALLCLQQPVPSKLNTIDILSMNVLSVSLAAG